MRLGTKVKYSVKSKSSRVAYITDVYPKISLTFIDMEIQKLRDLGMHLDLYAIWRTRNGTISKPSRNLMQQTRYLSNLPFTDLLRTHYSYATKAFSRYIEMLKLCFLRHPTVRLRIRTLYNFLVAPYLAVDLEKKCISHIHAHFGFGAATVAMIVSELLNISFSFTAHGTDILVEKVLLGEKIKRAKFVITISEYNRQHMLCEFPDEKRSKIKTIHLGINPEKFSFRGHHSCTSPYTLIAVGNLVWQKGQKYLIEACKHLKSEGIDHRCVIIGEGPERRSLESLIQEYKLHENIHLIGVIPHEDINEYYNKADVLVHPSISEGIPVVLMEAMSKGIPVISTNITGIPELIENDKNGILVSSGDILGLAVAIMRLLFNTELRIRLGKNAREKVLQDFDIDRNIEKVKNLFKSELNIILS